MAEAGSSGRRVLGLDVGKSPHWACLVSGSGKALANRPVANSEAELDALFEQAGQGALAVDQVRNIGAHAIRRARTAGLDVAYLPGIAAHEASKLFAGTRRPTRGTRSGYPTRCCPSRSPTRGSMRRARSPRSASTWSPAQLATRTG